MNHETTISEPLNSEPTLSALLKCGTQDLHTLAERHDVQRALVSGRATRAEYGAYLAQMHRVHGAFESRLRECAAAGGVLGALVLEHHYRRDQLRQDLGYLGVALPHLHSSEAASSFAAWIDRMSDSQPGELLGVLYVLEGSTNGGQFIARAVRRGLGLGLDGTAYLDPHGEAQAARWGAFKGGLDALALDDGLRSGILGAARRTFASIIDAMDELNSTIGQGDAAVASR